MQSKAVLSAGGRYARQPSLWPAAIRSGFFITFRQQQKPLVATDFTLTLEPPLPTLRVHLIYNLHYEKLADGSVKCIEDEIPFELPEGWAWSRLGALLALFITGPFGSALHKSDYVADGIPLINPMNIIDGKVVPIDKMQVSSETVERLSSFKVASNDIVIARRGDMGRCAVVQSEQEGWLCGTGCFVLRLPANLCSEYFAVCLRSPYSVEYLSGNSIGNTMLNLNQAILKSILLPIPPCNEQWKIIDCISTADIHLTEIADYRVELTACVAKAKAKILDLAIRGKLVPQDPADEPASVLLERIRADKEELIRQGKIKRDKKESVIFRGRDTAYYEKLADGRVKCIEDEIPFELPDNWSWCRLGSVCSSIQYGLSNSAEQSGTHRLLRITDIQNGKVNWDNVPYTTVKDAENYLLCSNDIVFARTGATVGKSFLITDIPYDTVYASYLIRIRLLNGVDPSYVYDFFNSLCYWNQITVKAVGIGQPNCNGTSLSNLLIPIPPARVQSKITAAVKHILSYVTAIEKSLN